MAEKLVVWHSPGTRSSRVVWLLEELGDVPFEVKKTEFPAPETLQSPEFLALSPMGMLPAVKFQDFTVFESGAIVELLLEKFGKGRLAPPVEELSARAEYLQWFFWAEGVLAGGVVDYLWHTMIHPEEKRLPQVAECGKGKAKRALAALEGALEKHEYVAGAEFTAADIMVGQILNLYTWAGWFPNELPSPKAVAYLDKLKARPAWEKAFT